MKIGEWRRLTDYWSQHPPAVEMLEMQMGLRPRACASSPEDDARLEAEVSAAMAEGA